MKVEVRDYTFNKTAKTVKFNGYTSIKLENVLLITNVDSNVIIYNFAIPGLGGSVSGNTLTLDYNTGSMNNTDPLMVYYDDENVNSATDEMIALLKIIRKQMESSATVDRNNRQRVTIDAVQLAVTGTTTELLGALPITGAGLGTSATGQGPINLVAPYGSPATPYYQAVWEGPVDQRWRVMEDSRLAYQMGIRNKLNFG